MSTCPVTDFDHHSAAYRNHQREAGAELRALGPIVWSTRYGGFWVVVDRELSGDLARQYDLLSNDHDPAHERNGYRGIQIPEVSPFRGGFLEMDPPEQTDYRHILNPYLAPAATRRWAPLATDITEACIDDVIEAGRTDFVDDLANVVPAVVTLALMGLPLDQWHDYCEPIHAGVYCVPGTPAHQRAIEGNLMIVERLSRAVADTRANPRPGFIQALLDAEAAGQPMSDDDVVGTLFLLMGGGFDTTTALTANSLHWLSGHPGERQRLIDEGELIDTATEEFLRYFSPVQGDARTVTRDCEVAGQQLRAGDRMLLLFAANNRDPAVFDEPEEIRLDRLPNRHAAFGLGVHRCIGSNLARQTYKAMLTEVLDRLPDFVCDDEGAVRYESVGIINGYQHLPARFTPGERRGPGLDATLAHHQEALGVSA